MAYGQLPMVFETNRGQTDSQVKFIARGSRYGLFLTGNGAVLKLANSAAPLRMSLLGGRSNSEVTGAEALPGRSNYIIGNDPSRWHLDVPQFARVRYRQVYPGVDLTYYGKQGRLEYDFEIAAGADPGQVALQFQGTDKLSLDPAGNLVLSMAGGQIELDAPRVYQKVGAEQRPVAGKFRLLANQQVGFEIGSYDRSRELVIDPVLSYSTYLGGSGSESSPSIVVDAALNAYVAGTTTSVDFPIPPPVPPSTAATSFQQCLGDPNQPQPGDRTTCPAETGSDAFITKFDPSGIVLLFSTYVGGSGNDSAAGIAVDSGFNVVLTGSTSSADFPVLGGVQVSRGSSTLPHAFVTELNSAGQILLYSTYLAGNNTEAGMAVGVDANNKIYVLGNTQSTDFQVTPDAFHRTSRAQNQLFIAKLDPSTSGSASLVYSTYFGGGNPANGSITAGGMAVDRSGTVYFTGSTNFLNTGGNVTTDFPILNSSQACLDAPTNPAPCPGTVTALDAFVAKLNPSAPVGSHLIYSTYLGGTGDDTGNGIAIDTSGTAYVTGTTTSTDIPIPVNTVPFQQCLGAGSAANPASGGTCAAVAPNTDAYLAKISAFTTGSTSAPTETTAYFTYLGGTGNEQGLAVAVDAGQVARVTGSTTSGNFPTLNPIQAALNGAQNAFVSRIDTTAVSQTSTTHNSTYLGGNGSDRGTGIAVDKGGATYVTGDTTSSNFPRANPFQNALSGPSDAFVSKLGGVVSLQMTATASPNPVGVGSPVSFVYTIKNNGDFVPSITYVNNLPATGNFVSATVSGASGGNCGAPTGSPATLTCTLGGVPPTPVGTTGPTVTVVVNPTSNGGGAYSLGDSANLVAPGVASASANVVVNDFSVSLNPNSTTVAAGTAASYMVQVTPTGKFPDSVAIGCSGLPSGITCDVPNGTITDLTTGPQSRALVVNTTARVTTTAQLDHKGALYAAWLPGLAFLGLGIGGTVSRKRRALLGALLGGFLVLVILQAGCGSKSTTSTTTGTAAGKYSFSITASSGSVSHSQTAQLIVE
jgi:hypothetical protein